MFKELSEILASTNLSFILSEKNGTISATVIPKSKEGKDISNTPLSICGSPEEMDENFTVEIKKALGQAMGFLSNAEQFVKDAKAKEEDAKKKPEEKKESSNKTTAPITSKKKLTAAQEKTKKSAETNISKAKGEKDPDMVSFLKKQTVKLYTDAKFDTDDIAALEKEFDTILAAGPVEQKTVAKEKEQEPDLFDEGNKELTPPDEVDANSDEEPEAENETDTSDEAETADDDNDIF